MLRPGSQSLPSFFDALCEGTRRREDFQTSHLSIPPASPPDPLIFIGEVLPHTDLDPLHAVPDELAADLMDLLTFSCQREHFLMMADLPKEILGSAMDTAQCHILPWDPDLGSHVHHRGNTGMEPDLVSVQAPSSFPAPL